MWKQCISLEFDYFSLMIKLNSRNMFREFPFPILENTNIDLVIFSNKSCFRESVLVEEVNSLLAMEAGCVEVLFD